MGGEELLPVVDEALAAGDDEAMVKFSVKELVIALTKQLRRVEEKLDGKPSAGDMADLRGDIDKLEDRVTKVERRLDDDEAATNARKEEWDRANKRQAARSDKRLAFASLVAVVLSGGVGTLIGWLH